MQSETRDVTGARGAWRELRFFLRHHPVWWLTPILLVFASLLFLAWARSSAESGFVYDLF